MAKVRDGNIVLSDQQTLIVNGVTVINTERKGEFSSIVLESTPTVNITGFSTDGNLASNSDSLIPTQQAIKTYVDNSGGDVAVSGTPVVGQKVAWTAADTIQGVNYFAGALNLANNGYRMIDVLPIPAGQTITEDDKLYAKYDSGQGTICVFQYDANGVDSEDYYLFGVALNGGSISNVINVWVGWGMLKRRDTFAFANTDLGKPIWASTTPGQMSVNRPTGAGDHVNKVGTAISSNYILYRFSIDDTRISSGS